MTNEKLAALVLPWAKEHLPGPYAKTLAVASKPPTYRVYLLRLLELRWEQDASDWRLQVPLSVLEETSIKAKFRHAESGREVEVAGRGLDTRERRWWSFAEMAYYLATGADFRSVLDIKDALDLEVDDNLPEQREAPPAAPEPAPAPEEKKPASFNERVTQGKLL